jgi:hypothetical protein
VASTFTRTIRSVQADRTRWSITAACLVVLFLGAAGWAVFAEQV